MKPWLTTFRLERDYSTYLEEAKFIGRVRRPNNQSFHVAHVDIATDHGDCFASLASSWLHEDECARQTYINRSSSVSPPTPRDTSEEGSAEREHYTARTRVMRRMAWFDMNRSLVGKVEDWLRLSGLSWG